MLERDAGLRYPTTGEAACVLTGATWSYLDPVAFEGVPWDNEHECLYALTAAGAGELTFTSPPGCVTDGWKNASGSVSSDGRQVCMHVAT